MGISYLNVGQLLLSHRYSQSGNKRASNSGNYDILYILMIVLLSVT